MLNPNWVKEAVEKTLALEAESSAESSGLFKKAFDIGIGPAAILGALAGGMLGRNTMEQKYKTQYGNAVARILNEQNRRFDDMGTDYYTQVDNIVNDLKIVFTPVTVLFTVRGTVIDVISVENMNSQMRSAWERKDQNYFRTYILNKIMLDAQRAETLFVKQLLEHAAFTKEAIHKQAFDFEFVLEEPSLEELHYKTAEFLNVLSKSAEIESADLYAAAVLESMGNFTDSIPVDLGNFKYATELDYDIGMERLSFFSLGSKDDTVVITPESLKRNLKVAFLPDRVIYLSDNKVITQLNVMDMNEEGFQHFKNRKPDFFRREFFNYVSRVNSESLAAEAGVLDEDLQLEKQASKTVLEELFLSDNIHPKIYLLKLNSTFGSDWVSWDTETLFRVIGETFGVYEIPDIPTNKILFVHLLQKSDAPLTGYHTFEKCVRAFNNKLIDFEERESNLSLGEIALTCKIAGQIIADRDDNVYDNFSEHTLGYIVEVLTEGNYRVCAHAKTGALEKAFWDMVNLELLDTWDSILGGSINTRENNRLIAGTVSSIMNNLSRTTVDVKDLLEHTRVALDKVQSLKEEDKLVVEDNVIKNFAVNVLLDTYDDILDEQIQLYL